jgi:hypothetical protein
MGVSGESDTPTDKGLGETQRLLDEMDETMRRVRRLILEKPPLEKTDEKKRGA